jgi:MYXO-CTERM domain-containing protein
LFVAGLLTNNAGQLVKFTVVEGVVTGEETFDGNIAFPSGVILLPDGSLVVTSLGAGTSPGAVYKYDTVTGARQQLVSPSFSGNFDEDSDVDGDDLTAWRTAFGETDDAAADADSDGDSDGHDFLIWQRGLGGPGTFSPGGVAYYQAPVELSTAVPEPSAAVLALVGLAAGGWMRRRAR